MARPDSRERTANGVGQPSGFFRLGRALARHRWLVLAAWTVLFAAGILFIPRFHRNLTGPPLNVRGSESLRAQEVLDESFVHPYSEQDLIVFQSKTLTVEDSAYKAVISRAVEAVSRVPAVAVVIGPFDPRAQNQISADGRVAAALVGVSGNENQLLATAAKLQRAVHPAATEDVQVFVTGKSPLVSDLISQESGDLVRAERLGLPASLILLLIAFGTVVAAGVPILLALVGISVTFGILGAATYVTSWDLFVQNIATMVGLGVGIDYSLFIVTRYREELARHTAPADAIGAALATSGKTVFFSGATVLISLAGLLFVNAKIFSDLALGAMTTVAVMIAAALTLLPAMLAILGFRINRLAVPFLQTAVVHPDPDKGFWARWAHGVMRHPLIWTILTAAVLLALAFPVTKIELGLSTSTSSEKEEAAVAGRAALDRAISEGIVSPIQLVVADPHGRLNDQDLDAIARLTAALQADTHVARVVSVTEILDQYAGNHNASTLAAAAAVPQAAELLAELVNFGRGSNVTTIIVIPSVPPDSVRALDTVSHIRHTIVPQTTGDTDLTVLVGGLSAQISDISAETARKLPWVAGLVVLLAFVLLAMVFRSIFLPVKAIVMNVLSIGAAFGLLVVVFQEGWGERVLGFTSPGNIQVYLPLLVFAIVFGLSMDYELFLIGRIKEEWERTGNNTVAVTRGLEHTARVISSAAAIMVAVFGAFVFTRVLEVRELGFALASAVLIDATLIRLLLVPALMDLAGHWNWWFPPPLDRILPRIDLGEGAPAPIPAAAPAVKPHQAEMR